MATRISSLSLTLDSDLSGFATVQLLHSLDFRERHKVSIFQTVPRLVQTGDECLLTLRDQLMIFPRSPPTDLFNVDDHSG